MKKLLVLAAFAALGVMALSSGKQSIEKGMSNYVSPHSQIEKAIAEATR